VLFIGIVTIVDAVTSKKVLTYMLTYAWFLRNGKYWSLQSVLKPNLDERRRVCEVLSIRK
jgi:hypothetical protein